MPPFPLIPLPLHPAPATNHALQTRRLPPECRLQVPLTDLLLVGCGGEVLNEVGRGRVVEVDGFGRVAEVAEVGAGLAGVVAAVWGAEAGGCDFLEESGKRGCD